MRKGENVRELRYIVDDLSRMGMDSSELVKLGLSIHELLDLREKLTALLSRNSKGLGSQNTLPESMSI